MATRTSRKSKSDQVDQVEVAPSWDELAPRKSKSTSPDVDSEHKVTRTLITGDDGPILVYGHNVHLDDKGHPKRLTATVRYMAVNESGKPSVRVCWSARQVKLHQRLIKRALESGVTLEQLSEALDTTRSCFKRSLEVAESLEIPANIG